MIRGKIHEILELEGPLTGGELLARWGGDRFLLWKTCLSSGSFIIRRIGERYLRLDERIPGYSRLSPSILREFLTYTLIGTNEAETEERADILGKRIKEIGEWKTRIAKNAVKSAVDRASDQWGASGSVCFILAGDIAYGMAHSEPRPERSTGRMVRGSDLDIVAVLEDSIPESVKDRLDEEIYKEKYRLLIDPDIDQEIDYVVKYRSKLEEQLKFDTFKRMVACKILSEGFFLEGDSRFFGELKLLLARSGVEDGLSRMEASAISERLEAEKTLMKAKTMNAEYASLFYSAQESEEFE